MSATVTAAVATEHASRYLQQLCKHWGHRFEVDFTSERGRVALPPGPLELEAAPDALRLSLTVGEAGQLDRMKGVVEEHLNRFAHREAPLAFAWSPA